MFLTIALAVLVALGPWVQYLRGLGVPWLSWTMFGFYAAALALIVSIGCGFHVISAVYKRADGRPVPVSPAWSTEAVKAQLNGQAVGGIIALVALFFGFVFWAAAASIPQTTFSLSIPGSGTSGTPTAGPLSFEGESTTLSIKPKRNKQSCCRQASRHLVLTVNSLQPTLAVRRHSARRGKVSRLKPNPVERRRHRMCRAATNRFCSTPFAIRPSRQ